MLGSYQLLAPIGAGGMGRVWVARETRIIPGTGPVQTRADLKAEHDMLAAMHEKVWGLMRKGMTASEILAAKASADFDAKWGDPKQFITCAYQGIYGHIADFLGKGVV